MVTGVRYGKFRLRLIPKGISRQKNWEYEYDYVIERG